MLKIGLQSHVLSLRNSVVFVEANGIGGLTVTGYLNRICRIDKTKTPKRLLLYLKNHQLGVFKQQIQQNTHIF